MTTTMMTTTIDDDDDSGEGCAPIDDPFPDADLITLWLDEFGTTGQIILDYIATAPTGDIVALKMSQTGLLADQFQIQFPDDLTAGEHDLRWDGDPSSVDLFGLFIQGMSVSGDYEGAYVPYRGCMTIEETGEVGSNFKATLTNLHMTEAEVDVNSGQVQVVEPFTGGNFGWIGTMTIECEIAEYSTDPNALIRDSCMIR